MKTSELTGAALDWAVAKCENDELAAKSIQYPQYTRHYPKVSPSTNWAQGGPIIEREGIGLERDDTGTWFASYDLSAETPCGATSGSPIIAAMRVYVANKLGMEIELPEGLK